MNKRIYKYKLDFYYKSLIIYLVTLFAYIIIKGNFTHATFEVVIKDPIIYIISIFILFFLTVLLINAIKAKQIIFDERTIVFKNRFGQREVGYNEILSVRFSREKRMSREERSDVRIVKLKLKGRKRFLRIRLNDFQNESELIKEFKNISRKMDNKV
ncbi:MAG: hypothetical protein LH629_10475 [Ignavibacteria bacterium]|nr:hypothetical protein [Ignavibacteria bacterium]